MSSTSPQPPNLESVDKSLKAVTSLTNTLTEFVRSVADKIRRRQWIEILMLTIAIAVIFWGMQLTLTQVIAAPIFYSIWLVLGVGFFVSVVLALNEKSLPSLPPIETGKRKAIKFLSSFEQEDTEIFARLQGFRDLVLSENIIRPEYSFGVIKGKSGCGKSSYLKAGLLAELAKNEDYLAIYCKFSDLDSLETIRESFIESLHLGQQEVATLNFLDLLKKSIEIGSQNQKNFKALILIFDQFEQFFIYPDNKIKREAFIQDLVTWYNSNDLKEKVKILVSIREDWFARLDEIQARLKYTLRISSQTGGNSFYLKNFSAEEATTILAVMAQEDLGIAEDDKERFDRDYIQEVLERELASPTDRLISPVDLQIFAETIKQQNTLEMRAFNQKSLQKLGGIEGLRRSFLERILEDLSMERKKFAVQVLVALTNLEQQTRAEVQTLAQLQEKVRETVPQNEVAKTIAHLQETGLVAVVERQGIKGYELAHEGTIAPVIRLGWQVQDDAHYANQLLERRVNEWLINDRTHRYCFSLRELWLIQRQKPYLIWGNKRKDKESLIAASKQQIYRYYGIFGGIVVFIGLIWSAMEYTTMGQMIRVRGNLTDLSQQISNPQYQATVVEAFAKDRDFSRSTEIANRIRNYFNKTYALITIIAAMNESEEPDRVLELLDLALDCAGEIQNNSDKADALIALAKSLEKFEKSDRVLASLDRIWERAKEIEDRHAKANALSTIATAYSKFDRADKALELFALALDNTDGIQNPSNQVNALSTITENISKLDRSDDKKALPLLDRAFEITKKIEAFDSQARSLSTIATAYSKFGKNDKALELLALASNKIEKIAVDAKAPSLIYIATAYGKLDRADKALELLALALKNTEKIEHPNTKARVLSAIAEAYGQLDRPEKGLELLDRALDSAEKIENIPYFEPKADALSAIAATIGQFDPSEKGLELLDRAWDNAKEIPNFEAKTRVLIVIAEAYSRLDRTEKGLELLDIALKELETTQNRSDRSPASIAIATAYGNLDRRDKATQLLDQVLTDAGKIEDSSEKAKTISTIAATAANLKNWGQALKVAQQCPTDDCEVESLARVLIVRAEQK